MGATQTRRSISIKGLIYQRIEDHCVESGKTVSGFVEELLADKIGEPDDEDRRKFGEAMAARQKVSEAQETKARETKDTDDVFDEPYTRPIRLF